MTTLEKSQDWYNPMFLNGKQEIENIFFFNHQDGTLFEDRGGRWFSSQDKGNSNNNFKKIVFFFDTTRSLNKDKSLLKPKAFYVKTKEKNYSKEQKYDVYIPITLLSFEPKKEEFLAFKDEEETHYQTRYWIEEKSIKDKEQIKLQRLYWFSYYRIVKTKRGEANQKVVDAFKDAGVRISTYELEKLNKVMKIQLL